MDNQRYLLRDYEQSRAVLIGTWEYSNFDALPAARNSLRRMKDLLTGPWCGWPNELVISLENMSDSGTAMVGLSEALEGVTGIALFYFVGHGQNEDDHLCLALSETKKEYSRRQVTSLRYSDIRQVLLDCRAAVKIVILDCCWSGLAMRPGVSLGSVPQDQSASLATKVADLAQTEGVYIMVAATSNTPFAKVDSTGRSPEASFTKHLADVIDRGIPGGEPNLTLETLFKELRKNMVSAGLPAPERRNINAAAGFEFARNAAADSRRGASLQPSAAHRSIPPGSEQTNAAAAGTRRVAPPRPSSVPAPNSASSERANFYQPPPMAAHQRSVPPRRRGRSTPIKVAVIAAGLVTGGLLLVSFSPDTSSTGSATPLSGDSGKLRLARELVADRSWQISGRGNSQYSDTVVVQNISGKAIRATLAEPVSQITIPFIKGARFTPRKPTITEAGLMLEWPACIPAHGVFKTSYQITVPGIDLSVTMSMDALTSGDLSSLSSALGTVTGKTPPPQGPTASPAIPSLSVLAGPAC
jgi:hypothetical protein